MKKLISLMLAVLMVALCACGIAEETEGSGKTAFLRIKEGVTAQVFKKPGDKTAIDTLAGGTICGLLDEVTAEDGAAWFNVFYLNSEQKGTTGYISAEDAEQLTEEQLKALMDDPATFNEILNLVDALDIYLNGKTGNTGTVTVATGSADAGNELSALYKLAMDALQKLLNTGVSVDMGNLKDQGKKLVNKARDAGKGMLDKVKMAGKNMLGLAKKTGVILRYEAQNARDRILDKAKKARDGVLDKAGDARDGVLDKAKDAGKDLLEKAKKAGENLKGNASDALKKLDGKTTREAIDSLMDRIDQVIDKRAGGSDLKIDEALTKMSDALKELDKRLGTDTGKSIDSLSSVMNKTRDWLSGEDFGKVNDAMKKIADKFKGNEFVSGIGKESVGDFLDQLKDIFPKK